MIPSYPFLMASYIEAEDILKKVERINFITNSQILQLYSQKLNEPVCIDLDQYITHSFNHSLYKAIADIAWNLKFNSLEDLIAFYSISRLTLKETSSASIKYKSNHYVCMKKARVVPVDTSNVFHNEQKLVAGEAIISGYDITEYPGSHFLITSPQKIHYVVKQNHCSCNSRVTCCHKHLASFARENRKSLSDRKILNIKWNAYAS